jgi:ribosome-associated protein
VSVINIRPEEFVTKIVEWIEDKNGSDVDVINISEISTIAYYFVITSGNSERQVQAIADNVEDEAQKLGIYPKGIEGRREGRWILLDYYDVIVHVFHNEERKFYNLERLWADGIIER